MSDKGDRQMRLRPKGEETDEDTDQSASLGLEGQDWALQGKEVHRVANEQRPNGASQTDVPEQQGEEARHWRGGGGKCEKAKKAVKSALEEELIAEMYEMIL